MNIRDFARPEDLCYGLYVPEWNKEYKNRYSKYLEDMRRSLEIDIRIQEISRVANIKTKQKIQEILNLKPDINNKDISDILGVTIRTVERHRK